MPLNPYAQHSGARIFDSEGDPIDNVALESNPKDFAGRKAFNTVFGEQVFGWRVDSISVQFQYNISTRDAASASSGGGSVVHSSNKAVAQLDTAIGSASLTTKDAVRYRPGHEVTAQFTSVYSGLQAGVKHYHGVMNGTDGFAFGTKDGEFGVWYIHGGSEEFVPRSAWLGDKLDGTGLSGVTIDPAKLAIYQVQYGWLGTAPAVFSVYCGYAVGWVVCHYIDFTNFQTVPHLSNPTLPMQMKVVRESGTGTAATLGCASMRAGVTAGEEEDNSSNRWFSYTLLDVAVVGGAGVRENVFQLINNSTFQGKTNHILLELAIITFDNAGNKTVAFYGTKGATVTGGAAPASVDAANSVISVVTGGTITGGAQGPATVVHSNTDRRTDVLGTGIKLYPGETFAFEVQAGVAFTGTISLSARWVEYF